MRDGSASTSRKELITVVVSVFNESESLVELTNRLKSIFDAESGYDFECLLIENGSSDGSRAQILAAREMDPRFKLIQLSRNFRMGGALTAGMHFAAGDACVLMAADLQDPPEVIPEFIRQWEKGYENIYAQIIARDGGRVLRNLNSRVFYWLAGRLSGGLIKPNVSDFRLIDRKVLLTINQMEERGRFMRGLFSWAGYRSVALPISRPPRFAGESKADFRGVSALALRGILSNSYVPLRLLTGTGALLAIGSIITLLWQVLEIVLSGVPFDGFGTLVSLTVMGFGFMFGALGLLGEYIALIFEEVKQRPNFVVSELVGVEDTSSNH